MTDLEAIRVRRSRRAYTGPLETKDVLALQAEIAALALDSGLHITLVEDGASLFGGITKSYGMFSGVHSLLALSCGANNAPAREAAGYYGQRLVLDATKMGLGTCWVGGTYDRKKMADLAPAGTEILVVITLGPVKEKPTFVERTVRVATHRGGPDIGGLYVADEIPPAWFLDGVRAAALAPSALNKLPTRFAWKNGVATAFVPEGRALNLVDLGIAKLHFEVAAKGKFDTGNGAVFRRAE